MKIQIALTEEGDIHIWPGDEMPPADNLIDVELVRDGDMYVIPADAAGPLRQLLGTGEARRPAARLDTTKLQEMRASAEHLLAAIEAEIEGISATDPSNSEF